MHHDLTWSATQLRRLKELQAPPAQRKLSFKSESGPQPFVPGDFSYARPEGKNPALGNSEKRLRPRLCLRRAGWSRRSAPRASFRSPPLSSCPEPTSPEWESPPIILFIPGFLDRRQPLPAADAGPASLLPPAESAAVVGEAGVHLEVGPCFRKESGGARRAAEFTMLNLVEAGLPLEERAERIRELAVLVAEAARLSDYRLETTHSEVYGESIDIIAGENSLEVGSSAMGPHALDRPWRITDAWVGSDSAWSV